MPVTPEKLHQLLKEKLQRPVSLRINSNVRTMISTRVNPLTNEIRISLHRMFLEADDTVLNALISCLQKPTLENEKTIDGYIEQYREKEEKLTLPKTAAPAPIAEEGSSIHTEDLRRYLSEATGRPITLRMNTNTHSMITARPDHPGPGIIVSLHRMFLQADEKTLQALAIFIHQPTPKARKIIQDYIALKDDLIHQANAQSMRPRRINGTPKGEIYNLAERADQINSHYFQNRLDFRIIWGKESRTGGRQRHITLGTWNPHQQTIRIHPILDQKNVPEYFLDYIIFHEMCHIVVPAQKSKSGRNHIHSKDFYLVERQFKHYVKARQWEKTKLSKLINNWNRG